MTFAPLKDSPSASQVNPNKSDHRRGGNSSLTHSPPSHPSSQQHSIGWLLTRAGQREVQKLLHLGLNSHQLKLNRELLLHLETTFKTWVQHSQSTAEKRLSNVSQLSNQRWLLEEIASGQERTGSQAPRFLCDFIIHQLDQNFQSITRLKTLRTQFRRSITTATRKADLQEIILYYAAELGASSTNLRKDEQAFARWFDEEAISDRFEKKIGQLELQLCFTLERFARTVDHLFDRASELNAVRSGGNQQDLTRRISGIWQRLDIESALLPGLIYDGDPRVHVASIGSLRLMLHRLPEVIVLTMLSPRMFNFIDRSARQKNSNVWLQCEALTILSTLSFASASEVMKYRLSNPGQGDDMFVRQHIWGLVEKRLQNAPSERLILPTDDEPSSFVRQKMAAALFLSDDLNAQRRWNRLARTDVDPKVRAAAITVGLNKQLTVSQAIRLLKTASDVCWRETDPFVLRTTLHVLAIVLERTLDRLEVQTKDDPEKDLSTIDTIVDQQVIPAINRLRCTHPHTPVRRWAAQASENLWILRQPKCRSLLAQIRHRIQKIRPGRSKTFPSKWFDWIDDRSLARIFAILAQNDFGFDVQKTWRGLRVTRGPVFGFRLWRFWYEIRHSATDKRPGFRHTIGRINTAELRVPSGVMGELSQTKVPGEPLTIASDGTWRPFLPLVDDLISILNSSWRKPKTVRFATSEGITIVTAPKKFLDRLRACLQLTHRFAEFAQKRNWNDETVSPDDYINSIRDLHFEIEFQPHTQGGNSHTQGNCESSHQPHARQTIDNPIRDDSVLSFFQTRHNVLAPVVMANGLWESISHWFYRYANYFSSLFENSLIELIGFTAAVLVLVCLKHAWANLSLQRARKRIPLSIGGWGTRGKSGTERLKAALLGVAGHGLVSKTTGCEAMFIHAYPFGEPLEVPLFRPYDKATIWEQKNLLKHAEKMEPSVFLWECMALNPDYVNVLQRQWMRDDLATITNTYPDHEDIQGPAGYNVAETIAGFAPQKSHVITTEEQMLPYVRQQCDLAASQLQTVSWLESGLISDDLLERFPYSEHPDNIALVSALAGNLGISYERAVKAMADDLVPDLGVLKTHPVATVNHRRIEFTNGMSANERFGCMGNWQRLGYASQDPWEEPDVWICGVVNNRADRVPRSKVFAQIIVDDIQADRFFLIGTNLSGLKNFISEAWQQRQQKLTLKVADGSWDTEHALQTLRTSAWEMRQPIDDDHVTTKLKCMVRSVLPTDENQTMNQTDSLTIVEQVTHDGDLSALLAKVGVDQNLVNRIIAHQTALNAAVTEYRQLHRSIMDAGDSQMESDGLADVIDQKYQEQMRQWFQRKIVVIPDAGATGEEVITRIVDEVPPGFLARTMGLQNIKGTGMDFVYRFQAWDACYEACQATESRQIAVAEKAIAMLSSMPTIGSLCREKLIATIQRCRQNRLLQRSDLQSQLDGLEARLAHTDPAVSSDDPAQGALTDHCEEAASANRGHGERAALRNWLLESAEQFFDVNDSIRRREKADQIYADLSACRISRQRAIVELRKINKRQKGGWLKEDSNKFWSRLIAKS